MAGQVGLAGLAGSSALRSPPRVPGRCGAKNPAQDGRSMDTTYGYVELMGLKGLKRGFDLIDLVGYAIVMDAPLLVL